jgi:oligopeptidase B
MMSPEPTTLVTANDTPAVRGTGPVQPPIARRIPAPTVIHGQTLADDYAWMRDKSSPEVIAHLNAENAYTEAIMAPTKELQADLYVEMLSHIKETDESVPYPDRGWLYWTRTIEGSQYPIYCRRNQAPGSPEEILLDVNQLAKGQPYMAVGAISVSPNGNLLAYTTDNTGFRQYTLHLRDLSTAVDLPDSAERVGSIVWAADSATLLYTTEDETTKRHDRAFRHVVGSPEPATQIFHELDERFNIGLGQSRDRKYIFLEAGSHTTSETRFFPSATPTAEFTMIAPRVDDQEYYVDHRDGLFYIRTNDETKNFRLVTAPVATPDRDHWREVFRNEDDIPLEDFDLFQSFCVLTERKGGLPTLAVYPLTGYPVRDFGNTPHEISFPEPAYSAGANANREFTATHFRYSYQSLVSPASVYDYNVVTGQSTLLKRQEVPGGFNPDDYASERLWIEASDRVMIPVSLVYRRNMFHNRRRSDNGESQNPLYVYGYGSYGYALPVGFSPTRLTLLDRGFIIAYAHIRGGGELGDKWHDAGKMRDKLNTFTDFITVVETLLREGYGAKDRVAIEGGSAGGLLMGAVVNQRPELFHAVLSHVPFVDVMNTMLDASLPLTVAEYEEWGNPNEPDDFAYMHSYSPYENLDKVDPDKIPAMLVKTSLNDSQVMYWEPAKYVAKLRTIKRNNTPLLLHINMEAGHGGASGRYDYLKEIAFDHAFLLTQLGVDG